MKRLELPHQLADYLFFLGQGSIGKREYNFGKEFIGYKIISNEGKAFKTTLNDIHHQSFIESDKYISLFEKLKQKIYT